MAVTRRQVIKRAGAGGALLWATPAVVSAGRALAAASGPECPCSVEGFCNTVCYIGPLYVCACVPTNDGSCACVVAVCAGADCETDADCNSGQLCLTVPCCGSQPRTFCSDRCAPRPVGSFARAGAAPAPWSGG